jgi:hypothetical protein
MKFVVEVRRDTITVMRRFAHVEASTPDEAYRTAMLQVVTGWEQLDVIDHKPYVWNVDAETEEKQ